MIASWTSCANICDHMWHTSTHGTCCSHRNVCIVEKPGVRLCPCTCRKLASHFWQKRGYLYLSVSDLRWWIKCAIQKSPGQPFVQLNLVRFPERWQVCACFSSRLAAAWAICFVTPLQPAPNISGQQVQFWATFSFGKIFTPIFFTPKIVFPSFGISGFLFHAHVIMSNFQILVNFVHPWKTMHIFSAMQLRCN